MLARFGLFSGTDCKSFLMLLECCIEGDKTSLLIGSRIRTVGGELDKGVGVENVLRTSLDNSHWTPGLAFILAMVHGLEFISY